MKTPNDLATEFIESHVLDAVPVAFFGALQRCFLAGYEAGQQTAELVQSKAERNAARMAPTSELSDVDEAFLDGLRFDQGCGCCSIGYTDEQALKEWKEKA